MQIGTVVFAILNIILEGSVFLMVEMGVIEYRGLALPILGTLIILFAFFSIPVRRWWALVVDGISFLYEMAALLILVFMR